ncbi:MAG: terminase small subunit [Rubrivivax sp.]
MTPKQQRFVEEYLVDLNASAAARRAGYSVRTAEWQGPQLLGKPHVASAVAARRAELQAETGITQRMVLDGLRREAEFDGEGSSHAARVAAWSWLGRHLGTFEADNKQRNPLGNFEPKRFMAAVLGSA